MPEAADDPVRRLAALRYSLERLSGVRAEAAGRALRLSESVAQAKGILSLDAEVKEALESFQAVVLGRTVRSYEDLLTKLVTTVLPEESEARVRMELSTHAGAPALDILVERSGVAYDIMSSEGGALTNVVCLGLRLIATLRSASRPFLVLDEADHWLESDRVASFYQVLGEVSETMGLQVLAVTHKDVSHLRGARPRIVSVEGDPRSPEGLSLRVLARGREWQGPAQPGIRSVHLIDFAGYADCSLELSPGLNVVVGPNNRGKSRFQRALSVLSQGGGRDEDIRVSLGPSGPTRAKSCAVRVVTEAGGVEWTRVPGRTPVEAWRRLSSEGAGVETQGKTVPAWVDEVAGISPRAGLDVQLWGQKRGPFLFGETPSRRAEVLNVGREGGLLVDMMKLHRRDVSEARKAVSAGEAELRVLEARLSRLAILDEVENLLARLERGLSLLNDADTRARGLRSAGEALSSAGRSLERARAVQAALSSLPPPPAPLSGEERLPLEEGRSIARLSSLVARASALARAAGGLPDVPCDRAEARSALLASAQAILPARAALSAARAALSALEGMPPSPPDLEPGDLRPLSEAARTILGSLEGARRSRAARADAEEGLEEVAREWREMAEGVPCPTCGSRMSGRIGEDAHAA